MLLRWTVVSRQLTLASSLATLQVLAFLAMVILITGCGGRSASNNSSDEMDAKALIDLPEEQQLGSRERIGIFTIQPPAGLESIDMPQDGMPQGTVGKVWGGRSNLSAETGLVFLQMPLPPGTPKLAITAEKLQLAMRNATSRFQYHLIVSSSTPTTVVDFFGKEAVRAEVLGYDER